jgi:Molybdopterin-binding domain of aldehyde dehydrogenase
MLFAPSCAGVLSANKSLTTVDRAETTLDNEVRVDPELGLVRLNRFVSAYDAGRVINPKTARSQAIAGIIRVFGPCWSNRRLIPHRASS